MKKILINVKAFHDDGTMVLDYISSRINNDEELHTEILCAHKRITSRDKNVVRIVFDIALPST